MNVSTDPPDGGTKKGREIRRKGRETRKRRRSARQKGRGVQKRRRPSRRRQLPWQSNRRFRRRRCRRQLGLCPSPRRRNELRREAEREPERGAGTVLTVGFSFVICTFTVVLLMVASTCASIAKAQNAADMVALASAQRNAAGLGGCPSSAYVERAYGASLVACDVEGALAKVKVSKKLTYMGVTYVAEAWAGPVYSTGEKE